MKMIIWNAAEAVSNGPCRRFWLFVLIVKIILYHEDDHLEWRGSDFERPLSRILGVCLDVENDIV